MSSLRLALVLLAFIFVDLGCSASDAPPTAPVARSEMTAHVADYDSEDDDDDDNDDDDEGDDDNDADDSDQDDVPHFLRPAPDAPPFATTRVSFYAVRGRETQARFLYLTQPGDNEIQPFVNFVVPAGALLTRPDGTPFALGDSILITLTLADRDNLIMDFMPTGLRFATADPARLEISYGETDDDINDDGEVDDDDEQMEQGFSIWKQDHDGAPWIRLQSVVDVAGELVGASLFDFTNYAIAY